jgi:hypothetical protein
LRLAGDVDSGERRVERIEILLHSALRRPKVLQLSFEGRYLSVGQIESIPDL